MKYIYVIFKKKLCAVVYVFVIKASVFTPILLSWSSVTSYPSDVDYLSVIRSS